jgi:hypothetical protein
MTDEIDHVAGGGEHRSARRATSPTMSVRAISPGRRSKPSSVKVMNQNQAPFLRCNIIMLRRIITNPMFGWRLFANAASFGSN